MITADFIISWLGIMFPLVFSPGPGNIVLAGSGISQGILKSIPLIVGINLIIFLYALLLGFGIDEFVTSYPNVFFIVKICGILYIIYLALKFLKRSNHQSTSTSRTYTFYDGIILQLFNPKGLVMILLMFSLFIKPATNSSLNIIYLILMLLILYIM